MVFSWAGVFMHEEQREREYQSTSDGDHVILLYPQEDTPKRPKQDIQHGESDASC